MTGTAKLSPKSITSQPTSKPKGSREEQTFKEQTLQKLQVKVPSNSAQEHGSEREDVFQPQPGRVVQPTESSQLPVDNEQASVRT